MNFRQLKFGILLLLLFVPLVGYGQMQVISKSDGQLTLRLHLNWQEQTLEKSGTTYSYWVADGINGTTLSQGYELPVVGFKIPLPPGAQPSIEITDQKTVTKLTEPLYRVLDSSDMESADTQRTLVHYNGQVSVRGFQLGDFEIHPLRYQNRSVVLTTDATLTISWPKSSATKTSPNTLSEFDQQLLQAMTINPGDLVGTRAPSGVAKAPPAIERNGTWYRIPVNQTGIYTLNYSWLQSHDVPLDNIDVQKIRMFAAPNYGLELDTPAGASLEEIGPALHEIPITVQSNDDLFNSGDAIEFFGQAQSRYTLDQNNNVTFHQNEYDSKNFYWLNIPAASSNAQGLRVQQASVSPSEPVRTTSPGFFHFEEDLNNYMNSGKQWFGKILFGTHDTQTFPLDLEGILPDSGTTLKIRVARGNDRNQEIFSVSVNQSNPFTTLRIPAGESVNSTTSTSVVFTESNTPFKTGANSLTLTAEGSSSSAQGLLDYVDIRYLRQLTVPSGKGYLQFFSAPLAGIQTFEITGLQSDAQVFDVSDPSAITELSTTANGNALRFSTDFGTPAIRKAFYIAEPEVRLQPAAIQPVESFSQPVLRTVDNQTVDYIIVTPSIFAEEAQRLADHRSTHYKHMQSGLRVKVALLNDIYNEFSGGLQDPHAIRNFLIWAYRNWRNPDSNEHLQYVLLFGDGDYDFRNISGNSQILIPTYQNDTTNLYSTKEIDDFFTWVDGQDDANDLALGRLTASSPDEARAMVDKIIAYDTSTPFGQWRNSITMVGDDPFRPHSNEPYHITKLENEVIPSVPSVFNIRKIYLPDFPIVEDLSSFGVTRPGVTEALLDQLKQGTLVVNFSGHGSPKLWTQERVLSMDRDLSRIDTGIRLPLWIAATCEWGRFDMIGDRCMAEGLMALSNNGAIGTISATRLSFLGPNLTFMANFFRDLFSNQENRSYSYPLGVAVMAAKNSMTGDNKRRYALLGDPALQLASPDYSANFTQLNPDTLSALTQASFAGSVRVSTSQNSAAFTGSGLISVYDTDKSVHHEWPRTQLNYKLPGSRIFYGPVSITNGEFSGNFVVPKDITYGGDDGKISVLYLSDDSITIGAGIRTRVPYRGTGSGLNDTEGPTIQFGVKGYNFRSGDAVPRNASLDILISDENGLNLTGSIGHQIKLLADGPTTQEYDVTEFFSYDVDSYQQGHLEYPLTGLESGKYTLTLRAWDTSNNLSIRSSEIQLIEDAGFQVAEVVNFPNPMQSATDFTFTLSAPAKVKIRIYTLAGQPIETLQATYSMPGFQTLHWNGLDQFGARVANGVYLYKVTASALDSEASDIFIGKLAVTL